MSIKLKIQCALIMLAITSSMHCDPVTQLDPLSTTTIPDSFVASVDWCDCNYLAVGGFNGATIYQFDQTTQTLSFATSANPFIIIPVKWCPASSCQYLTVGGYDNSDNGQIQIYQFEQSPTPNLIPIPGAHQQLGTEVDLIDWCPTCSYLAAGGYDETLDADVIQLYYFDGNNLTATGPEFLPATDNLKSLRWCDDCRYLAAAGGQYLEILGFDPTHPENGLTELYSVPMGVGGPYYDTVDWCGDCSGQLPNGYIAAGGESNNPAFGIIDIYKFDPTNTSSLTLVFTASIQGERSATISSLQWCQGCDNLAALGDTIDNNTNKTDIVLLYHFDVTAGTLSLVQTYTLLSYYVGAIRAGITTADLVSWCGDCSYLAVGDTDGARPRNGIIQLFKSEFITAPTNLTAQKICHRFPTQIDIINQLCWNAVDGAVAYNVYESANIQSIWASGPFCCPQVPACQPGSFTIQTTDNQGNIQTTTNSTLTVLLKTITNTPLCYEQHQIPPGKITTYYVTAIDANGNETAPTVVTI